MFIWFNLLLFCVFLSGIFMLVGVLFSKYEPMNREFISPLECGFNSYSECRCPLSLRFFIFAVVFVIFDVELVLALPILYSQQLSLEGLWGFSLVLFFLSLGLYLEWNNKAFDWVS